MRWGVPAALLCLAALVGREPARGLDALWKWLAVALIAGFAALFWLETE
jgi:hypothetical protein